MLGTYKRDPGLENYPREVHKGVLKRGIAQTAHYIMRDSPGCEEVWDFGLLGVWDSGLSAAQGF